METKLKINKEELHRLYLEKVNEVAEECDWVTHFTIEDVVRLISLVLEQNPSIVETPLYDELVLENTRLKERNEKLSKRHPTKEEALAQYQWLKENSKRNK